MACAKHAHQFSLKKNIGCKNAIGNHKIICQEIGQAKERSRCYVAKDQSLFDLTGAQRI